MKTDDFDFELPDSLIAQTPAAERRGARLLHLPGAGSPVHRRFDEFPTLLRKGDLIVLNETRVIPARLPVQRDTGGAVEVFLVRPQSDGEWLALVRPAKRLRAGERLRGGDESGEWSLEIRRIVGGEAIVAFPDVPVEEVLDRWGRVPLPPYVRRDATEDDRERYQTVFARVPGAVAAPTAGLHFDNGILDSVIAAGASVVRLVLHVGPGTFRPLPDGELDDHVLDEEFYDIPEDVWHAIEGTKAAGGRVVAVGTTVVRALESAARAGGAPVLSGRTRLFVKPPYEFRIVDCLLTNFHLPRSSLLCLVSAFAGRERILHAYREAVAGGYRFYSYGDATFLESAPAGEADVRSGGARRPTPEGRS